MKKIELVNDTVMYSINPRRERRGVMEGGEVITHHLPWLKTSPQLEKYIARGYTFDRPVVGATDGSIECSVCLKVCKSEFGLSVHMRSHKEE